MREAGPGPERNIAEMMAGLPAGAPPEEDVASRLCAGMDFSRRNYLAKEFAGLPQGLFAARAYAACFGHPPEPRIFTVMRDRLLGAEMRQIGLLREMAPAAEARGVRISGLQLEAWRALWMHSFVASLVLQAARAGRILARLPRNLRRKLGRKPAPAPFTPATRLAQGSAPGRPRIALLSVAAGEVGGAERFYAGLESALNQAGMAVERIALESPEQDIAQTADSYRRFYDLDLSAYDGVISAKAPSYAARHPNHVCYLMHTMRSWYDMFEASHPFASARTKGERRQVQALDTAALQNVRKRFAIGEEVAQRLRAYNGLDAEVLHLPSTLQDLHEGPFEHLLMPGRLHPWKRVELAIAAMRLVKSPVRLVIAGTGQEEARLRAMAKNDKRIVLTGWVSEAELAALYAKASAVLLLPRREDLGLVTFEAFDCGKPVITCTDSGEPARLVRDGQSGFVCPPEPSAIAARIEQLAGDPARAAAMGLAGRASVADVRWDHVAGTLIAALGL